MIGIDIKNKIRITGLPLNVMKDIMKELTYENPDFLKRKRGGRSTWGCPSKIIDYEKEGNILIVPRGFSEKLKKHIKGLEINFTDSRIEGMDVDWGPLKKGWVARDYQLEAIEKCSNNSGLLKMPAGCVDADTEFFTGDGWKKISEYIEGDKVLQFNKDWSADLVEPDEYIKKECKNMIKFSNDKDINMILSNDHDMLFYDKNNKNFTKAKALKIKKQILNNVKTKQIIVIENSKFKLIDFNVKISDFQTKDGFKYCFSVPSGMLVLKKNTKIFITGNSGKTFTGLKIASLAKKSTLWLTHKRDLITQSKVDAESMFPEIGKIGVIGGGKLEFGDGKLIIASIKTLFLHPELIEKLDQFVGLIITDEAHNVSAKQFKYVVSEFSAKHRLGLSATLNRPDGLSFLMYNLMGEILYDLPDEKIRGKEILTPEVKFIRTEFDFTQASIEIENSIDAGGEATYHDLLKALKEDELRKKLIVKNILDNFKGTYTMVYSQFVEYAESLEFLIHEEAKKRGVKVKTVLIHGALNKKIREERMRMVKKKEVDILIGTNIFKEGLNIPHLTHAHVSTPIRGDSSNSEANGIGLEQLSGRICRQDKDNPNKIPIIFDYCDLDNGIFKNQYYSRRRTYKRLNYKLGKVPKSKKDALDEILNKF